MSYVAAPALTTPLTAPAYDLPALRSEFPHTAHTVYLNHAGSSPLARRVRRAMMEVIDTLGEGSQWWDDGRADKLEAGLRGAVARLIHAGPDEVAIVPNTSIALNYVALSLRVRAGQNIIFCDKEFPSNVYPWMNLARLKGLEVRRVPTDHGGLTLRRLGEFADGNTALVAVSAVEFFTGHRTDVAALGAFCRERGIYLAVDGIQSLGHIPLDVRAAGVDFLAAGALKSLMGPPGVGLLYIRRALLDELEMPVLGATSVTDFLQWTHYHLDLRPEAARYEMGTYNWIGMAGMHAALGMLLELGLEPVDAWTTHLAGVLMDDLSQRGFAIVTPRDPAMHSSIVTFAAPDPEGALRRLAARNVVVAMREGHLRVSCHCYNTEAEMLRVGECL